MSATTGRKSFRRRFGACRAHWTVWGDKILAQYEQNASSQLKDLRYRWKKLVKDLRSARDRHCVRKSAGKWNRDDIFYGFQSFTFAPSIYRYDLKTGATFAVGQSGRAVDRSRGL
jgi:prolyl oligopeptidase PreP (S9A serine peptidase family)